MLLAQQSAKGNCICWALVLPQHFPDVYRIRAGGDDIRSEVKISLVSAEETGQQTIEGGLNSIPTLASQSF